MSDHAKTVLWIGLLMIVFSVVLHWSQLKAVLFSGSGGNGPYSVSNIQKRAAATAKNQGRPLPGSVQSRL